MHGYFEQKIINSIGKMSANTVKMDETVATFENDQKIIRQVYK